MVGLFRRAIPKDLSFRSANPDRAEVLHEGIAAYAGTYSVDGNKVTHHVVGCLKADWIGSDQVRHIELNGKDHLMRRRPKILALGAM